MIPTHTMYTRQRYDDDHEMRYRMELARETSIASMVAALKRALYPVRWRWAILPRHEELVRQTLLEAGWTGEFLPTETWPPEQLEDDDISSTLDSDDKVAPGFLRIIQRHWAPGKPFIVTWQPVKERYSDGAIFEHRFKYTNDRPSPFYAIYNPTSRCYVYRKKHGHMDQLGAPVTMSKERGAIAVIHGRNKLMDISSRDKQLTPTKSSTPRRRGQGAKPQKKRVRRPKRPPRNGT